MIGNKKTEGNFESILESLYELWIDQDPVCDESVRELYRQMGKVMSQLSLEESDRLNNIIADLCVAYSRGAFLDGAKLAGALIRELLLEKGTNPLTGIS